MKKLWVWIAVAVGLVAAIVTTTIAVASQPTFSVYFASESYEITADQKAAIDAHKGELNSANLITIQGFVQNSPSSTALVGPEHLSMLRAQAVEAYIRSILKDDSVGTTTIINGPDVTPAPTSTLPKTGPDKPKRLYVVQRMGQPLIDFSFKDARRVEVYVQKSR